MATSTLQHLEFDDDHLPHGSFVHSVSPAPISVVETNLMEMPHACSKQCCCQYEEHQNDLKRIIAEAAPVQLAFMAGSWLYR